MPGWAGHVALVLCDLRPVGGRGASFQGANTLTKAIATLVASEEACDSIIHVTLGIARKSSDDEYHAKLLFEKDGIRQTASYVSKMAYSLLEQGAEKNMTMNSRRLLPHGNLFLVGNSSSAFTGKSGHLANLISPLKPIGESMKQRKSVNNSIVG